MSVTSWSPAFTSRRSIFTPTVLRYLVEKMDRTYRWTRQVLPVP